MTNYRKLGLNRISCPDLSMEEFIRKAAEWGFKGIELRNDLEDSRITNGLNASEVLKLAESQGLEIISINALQRFNDGDPEAHIEELESLVSLASELGGAALVMCPVNDSDEIRNSRQCLDDTVKALKAYAPVFKKYGVTGLVEPLGFSICSLRTKKMAAEAIKASGEDCYGIVHDTFHHFLAEEKEFFPELTGLIHISGVETSSPMEKITDDDRILIGGADRMDNRGQVKNLLEGGYSGMLSYEAFSPSIQSLSLDEGLKASNSYLFS